MNDANEPVVAAWAVVRPLAGVEGEAVHGTERGLVSVQGDDIALLVVILLFEQSTLLGFGPGAR